MRKPEILRDGARLIVWGTLAALSVVAIAGNREDVKERVNKICPETSADGGVEDCREPFDKAKDK